MNDIRVIIKTVRKKPNKKGGVLMGMNGKMETMARTEAGSVEEKILELFAPSLSGSDVPSLKDWDPMGYFDFE